MGRDYEEELHAVLEKVGQQPGQDVVSDPVPVNAHVETVAQGVEERAEGKVSAPRPFSARNMFVHHDTHPLVLDIKLMDQYGTSWFSWEASTLWREIMDDFHAPSISDHIKSKIQAVRTIHISDWCFTKWEVFCPILQALNNNIPDFEVLRKPTLSQLFAGVDMMTFVRNDVEFSPEVQQFCAASLLDAGVGYAPQPVAFCQDEIEEVLKQKKIDFDYKPVRDRYQLLISTPIEQVELNDSSMDTQVAKLVIARDYLALRRQQMKEQLKALR